MTAGNLVIVVDDDPVVMHLIGKVLERAHVEVAAVSSGAKALDLLRERPGQAALVFVDLAMPGISGVELARQIREQPGLAALPIVAVTANFGPESRDELEAVGIHEIIEKPFRNDQLTDVLRRHGLPAE